MCTEIMNTAKSRFIKPDCMRPGCKPSWNPLHASADGTFGPCSNTYRKHGRRERRRARKAELDKFVMETRKEKKTSDTRTRVDCVSQPPVGAMAPNNTTQYLMGNVYEDEKIDETLPLPHETPARLYSESLSPRSVSSALDSYYEGILAFQMRDFEELYGEAWDSE